MDINDKNITHYETIGEDNPDITCRICDYYWEKWTHLHTDEGDSKKLELARKVFEWTRKAVIQNPHDYSYRMGCCYALGIDCDKEQGFRLARKYWEDAFDFGEWKAADGIADLYEERLSNLPDIPENEATRNNCLKHIESWRKLARKWEKLSQS